MEITEKERNFYREKWIINYSDFFGQPLKLDDYRKGNITFIELYRDSHSRANDMVSDGMSIDGKAFNFNEIYKNN